MTRSPVGGLDARRLGLAMGLLAAAVLVPGRVGHTDTFPGSGTGALPDSSGNCGVAGQPLVVTFNVTGVTAPVMDVDVAMTLTHTWVGDVDVVLIDPGGASHVIFAGTASTTPTGCGDSSDLGGTYTFDDQEMGDWWAAAASQVGTGVLTPGGYRTTTAGDDPSGGAPTEMNVPFNGQTANGTWTLRFVDEAAGDTGSVTAASLGINEDCSDLTLDYDFVTGVEAHAACGTIDLGPNYVVLATGYLTVTSGTRVAFNNGTEVEIGGRLAAGTDSNLNPLLVALEQSRAIGELERTEESPAPEPTPPSAPNPDKQRELLQKP